MVQASQAKTSFDLWLQRELRRTYNVTLTEAVPSELMRLLVE